jgi:oxygen-independent coproporphyrinogen-3 oxidase
MIEAMINEIKAPFKSSPIGETFAASFNFAGYNRVETIYFGGGTPSLLNAEDIKKLLNAVYEKYKVAENAEITLEANPDDISEEKLQKWKSAGINRLSLGIQSFKNEDLVWMNRAHNAEQARHSIKLIKDAGFQNFSVDLIYGTPTLSDDDWKRNVETVIALDVPHLSCYALTVENKTALHKMIELKKAENVDPEKQASQFLSLMDWLNNAGYEHYEISNFAKPGLRSKHNSSYWQGKSYVGIGPSAHSFDGQKRQWNISNNQLYIQSLNNNIIPYEEETLTKTQQLNEYIMTSLRTIEGLDLNFIKEKVGEDVSIKLQTGAAKWNKKINIENDKILLTREGKLFADGIAADLFS